MDASKCKFCGEIIARTDTGYWWHAKGLVYTCRVNGEINFATPDYGPDQFTVGNAKTK